MIDVQHLTCTVILSIFYGLFSKDSYGHFDSNLVGIATMADINLYNQNTSCSALRLYSCFQAARMKKNPEKLSRRLWERYSPLRIA